jgi:hypothetical protein
MLHSSTTAPPPTEQKTTQGLAGLSIRLWYIADGSSAVAEVDVRVELLVVCSSFVVGVVHLDDAVLLDAFVTETVVAVEDGART